MKKLLFVTVIGLGLFSSCKKDWKCVCTDGTNTANVESYSGLTKKNAESKCKDVESAFQSLNSSTKCEIDKKKG